MIFDPLSLLSIGTKLIDKLIPDPAQKAIPEHLWTVFGFVMGGYIGGRTLEKMKGIK